MKNFKILAVVAMLAMAANVKAGTISVDTDATNLEILITGELVETYKVEVSNSDMDDTASPVGVLSLTDPTNPTAPVLRLDPAKSHAATLCKDEANTTIAYTQAGSTCVYTNGGSIAASTATFDVDFDVNVDLAGSGNIDLAASLLGLGAADDAFTSSTIKFGTDALAATAAVNDLVDSSDNIDFDWHGVMPMNQGPTFEETIVIDVTKQ